MPSQFQSGLSYLWSIPYELARTVHNIPVLFLCILIMECVIIISYYPAVRIKCIIMARPGGIMLFSAYYSILLFLTLHLLLLLLLLFYSFIPDITPIIIIVIIIIILFFYS